MGSGPSAVLTVSEVNRPKPDGSKRVLYWHAADEAEARHLTKTELERRKLNARRAGISQAGQVKQVKIERVELGEAETLRRVHDRFMGSGTMRQFGEWLRAELAKSERKPPSLRVVGSK